MTVQLSVVIRDPVLVMVSDNAEQFRYDFLTWLSVNMHVWRRFESHANRIWERGRRRYSARTIGEVLRHESALSENGGDFKLNNNRFPCLARLYAIAHPERDNFFEFRIQAGSLRSV